ncbi:RdgB/HAM1 family non-canonical purine NTP pyrophosphatase [Halothiobacillus neapolitanus]|uniref:dITP/XTP pyrophosphatase n=1 Tax=Halothiobacillus neapolitanus (strain ATCC 23641 / DSM 15147 / CIP 104769 / NCIMB 8539 / c2) TaxID=555778 RepID=D0KX11_HALNC|nr:RdgB/HAM1 family non-canonical purine NTP pyrophosphatase [Halothiobacillus neapolitanus]ACX97131.1 non-canonical purine NTP pyrophosphatase, rdgB/HAM1 family [Halothiobacillus neapolitanus c2]TDN60265.1 XTP/dITP diphosphohydrolase [Halothiobacillus neapolitanus]
MTTTLVIATHNLGKLREFEAMRLSLMPRFSALANIEFVPLTDWAGEPPEEDGDTFFENALIKARSAAALTGLPAIADDSGLEVVGLDGAPGIYSARYAGPDADDAENNQRLLQELAKRPQADRSARFVSTLAMVRTADDSAPLLAEGFWHGQIVDTPRGATGFGYDPLFYVPDRNCTAAELPASIKNRISHRAQALIELMRQLSNMRF